jgi:SAM-dependent methyltransferase
MGRDHTMSHQEARDSRHAAAATAYTFDNSGAETATRFAALATIFDPGTIRHLDEIGIGKGWRCLEVGAGGGSIATWLCEQVGDTGHVVATDIDTRFLQTLSRANLEVRRHDVACDPLPQGAFDLVHLRLVLGHVASRNEVLGRLIAALRPGGWMLAEEFDSWSLRPDDTLNVAETPLKAFAAMQAVMADHGFDGYYGRRLAGHMRAHGLADLAAEGRLFMFEGGTKGADLTRAAISQTRNEMIAAGGITAAEIEQDLLHLNSADFTMPSAIMWAVRARRPDDRESRSGRTT